jgi:hypothetical protein
VSASVHHAVTILAPVERVFSYLDDPQSALSLVPRLVEVREVAPLPNGGHRIRFVALGRHGKRCEWVSEHVDRLENEHVVVRARTDGFTTTAVRRFESTSDGTRLHGEVRYGVELPWPQRALTPVIELQLRRPMRAGLRSLLETVKARLEIGE